ncbi:MAG TPA: ADOP family duplicated permease [Acidobacteriaceae bacterium]|jgi:predicted permease|nr:ADOP family duplicated permease [Acidobacteriaceae bacterium]
MHKIWMDLKVAARRLRHSPGFALTAVVSLTMAIAANLVVFRVLNAAVQRPMGMAAPDRVWQVEQKPQGGTSQSYPDYEDYQTRNATFSGMAAYRLSQAAIRAQGTARESWDYEASGNYFDVFGVRPEVGRFFHASDEHGPNSAPYLVLSDAFWRSQFGADARVVGTTVDVNKHSFTIVGVAPATFHGSELSIWPDFWVPMVNAPEINGYSYLERRFTHSISVAGRLKPGVTTEQATEDLNAIAAQLAKQYPQTDEGLGARLVRPGMFGDQLGDVGRNFLAGILLLALLVLAAACVNLASVFAARAADRGRELAVRIAIGSSRWRVLRQVLMEAAVFSVGGGVVGAIASSFLLQGLSVWQPIAEFPIHVTVAADGRVYGLAALLAVASGVLPAVLTARQIWTADAMQAMKGTSLTVTRRLTVRDGLLGLQVALCALLVTCALVGLRGMERSLHAPIGFQPQGVMLAEMEMKMAGYSDASALPVQKRMIEEAERIPGVTAVGTIDEEPLNGGGSTTPVYRAGTTDFRNSNSVAAAKYFTISPGYLQAAQTRLVAGRDFNWTDDEHHPRVALVNRTFAQILFGKTPAVGQHFTLPGPTTYEIAGVVEDGKYESLTENAEPAMFWPLAQNNENEATLVIRSARSPEETAAALSGMLEKIDPTLPARIESWPEAMALVLFPMRVATVALLALGLLAGMLAATGIFGMASYTVARRLREMGIRVALGAQRMRVLRAAMSRTVLLLTGGSVAGLLLGILASRVLASIVYDATMYDPIVIVGALAAMVLIGTAAAAVPARRAITVDPAVLLRDE